MNGLALPFAEVIGDPIGHSKSPLIHRFWLGKLGLDADYRHMLVHADELAGFLASRRNVPSWRGCNVTIPHKQSVIAQLDGLAPDAAVIGAVNTIVNEPPGRLVGYNTDATGFLEPLRPWLERSYLFRMARVIGTGGAACAIAHALAGQDFTLVIIGRDQAKASSLAARLPGKHHAASLDQFAKRSDFVFDDRGGVLDLVVNATSLGMTGQPPLLLHFSHVPPRSIMYDIVYAPLETALLSEARQQGLQTIDGLSMLIGQAAVAFELFFGRPAPRHHDAELRALLIA